MEGKGRQFFSERPQTRAGDRRMVACLAMEFVPATLGPGGEELLESFLVGGQVLLEAVHRQFVTLTGFLPAQAAATHGASTCEDTRVTGERGLWLGLRWRKGWGPRRNYRGQGQGTKREGVWGCSSFVHSPSPIAPYQATMNRRLGGGKWDARRWAAHWGMGYCTQAAQGLRQQAGLNFPTPRPISYFRHRLGLTSQVVSGKSPTADVQSYPAHMFHGH